MAQRLFLVQRRGDELVVEPLEDALAKVASLAMLVVAADGDPAQIARRAAIDHFARNPEHTRIVVSTVSAQEGW